MRFVQLGVENFRAIRRVDLEFGAGINVLHGPNDLGKSTLAAAIRAALLVPPSGSQAESYASWFSGASPRVELTLVDGDGRWWKVKKAFGSGSPSSAELFHSKDGITYTLDCKGREVEERLRTLLAWGIPAPGGKGAPRGMPESFIANALLGGQDNADDILLQSLAADAADSGKLRLTQALASLAQDPVFKGVLLHAQAEVDQFFTATGQRKRGQGSRFTQAAERVKAIGDELGQRRSLLETSGSIEGQVTALRRRLSDAQATLDEANSALQTTRQRRERGLEREGLVLREAETKGKVAEIDAQKAQLAQMERDVEQARIQVDSCKVELATAASAVTARESERRVAEEAVRVAKGDEAARQQELKKTQLEKRGAELAGDLATARSGAAAVTLAMEARTAAAAAARTEKAAALKLDHATADLAQAVEKEDKGAVALETSRALLAFVRWRSAVASREEAAQADERSRQADAAAAAKDDAAAKVEREVARSEKKLALRESVLPSKENLRDLQDLERKLENAEAALGGGINVVVRPRRPLDVTTRIDGQAPVSDRLIEVRAYESERALALSIDDVAEIEITAGSAEARRLVESLRQAWETLAQPALAKAGVVDLAALAAATAALERERSASSDTLRGAEKLRAEAKGLREQAALHRQHAGVAPTSAEEVENRKAAIGDHELADLEAHYAALKKPPEPRIEQLLQESTKAQTSLHGARLKKEEDKRLAEFALDQARSRMKEADEVYRLRVDALPEADLDTQQAALAAQLAKVQKEQTDIATQLRNLTVEANRGLERAEQALAKASGEHDKAKLAEKNALGRLDEARQRHSTLEGALSHFRISVDQLDRAAAEAAWKAAGAALAAIPMDSICGPDDVLKAEAILATAVQQHGAVREELIALEGALTHVGGAALREEVQRLEEARLIAEAQQRALEVDADAWKLLRETLRTVENEEGAHLGRALAGPVGGRFSELTGGRYGELKLDPALKAEGVGVRGASADAGTVMEALSVGTRSQLAALIRLTVADQLRSAIVLDDHLVHTDVSRLAWFHEFLRKIAVNAQVIVVTCRPQDYLVGFDTLASPPSADLAGGTLRALDLGRLLQRHETSAPSSAGTTK